jgi:hypothetical protein
MEHALLAPLLADLSSAGSPIDILDDNALGSFAFGTRYTRMGCHYDLATNIITCLAWVLIMWG